MEYNKQIKLNISMLYVCAFVVLYNIFQTNSEAIMGTIYYIMYNLNITMIIAIICVYLLLRKITFQIHVGCSIQWNSDGGL